MDDRLNKNAEYSRDRGPSSTDTGYNVVQYFPDGTNAYYRRWLQAEEAVKLAFELSERPAARIGIVKRIIITDADDLTVFEWTWGVGLTYPTREMLEAERKRC